MRLTRLKKISDRSHTDTLNEIHGENETFGKAIYRSHSGLGPLQSILNMARAITTSFAAINTFVAQHN